MKGLNPINMKIYLTGDSLVIEKNDVKTYHTKSEGLSLTYNSVTGLVGVYPIQDPVGIDTYQRQNGSKYATFADLESDIGDFFTKTVTVTGGGGGGTTDPDVVDRLNNLETEVNRLATHPNMADADVFSYSGGTPPTLPADKNAYYVTVHGMMTAKHITLPANAKTGVVVSIDNQDKTDIPSLTFAPVQGETIDGVPIDDESIPAGNLVFLIKTDTGWVTGFSGYIPKTLNSIIDSIKLKLTGSLHTIGDIEAALRDRLHTFAEIRNEGFLESVRVKKTGGSTYQAKGLEFTGPEIVTFDSGTNIAKIDSSSVFSALIKEYGVNGRVRFDDNTKHFFFEVKQPDGSWLKKAEIGGSLIIDTVKFEESSEKPIVKANELGLYSKMVQVPAHKNTSAHQALRPFFVLNSGEEVPLVGVWGGKLRIPQPDGSDEYAAFESDITPAKIVGYITQELGNEDWKSGGSGSVPQSVLNDVAANKAELARLKTNIGQDAESVYTYRGSTAPTDLNNEKHKAYYLSFFNVGKGLVIDMPNPVDDLETGAVFCIDNNDKNNFFMLEPPIGETINGKSDQLKIRPSSVAFLVKAGTDWNVAFSGYLPPNLDTLVKAVQAKLPSGSTGPTIDEIQAQLKDRLHTFREIQNEFNNQLHTFDSIDSELKSRGYNKGMSSEWGLSDTSTVDPTTFIGNIIDANEYITPNPALGNQYIVFVVSEELGELVNGYDVNGEVKEFTVTSFDKSNRRYNLLVSKEVLDMSTNPRIHLNLDISKISGGLELDDGIINVTDIKKINVRGSKVENVGTGEINLINGVNVHMDAPDVQFGNAVTNELIVMPPLRVWDDDSDPTVNHAVRMELKPGTFASIASPSFLGYISGGQSIVGKLNTVEVHHEGAIWFDDVIVPASTYLFTDRANKAYGIQDYGDDDPNISGGVNFLIAFRVGMIGKAAKDGKVRIALVNKGFTPFSDEQGYLLDVNGNPLAVEKTYKKDDELGVLEVIGIVNAKGLKEFRCVVADDFENEIITLADRTENGTALMIQSIGHDKIVPEDKGKTSNALQQYELDNNQNIEFSSHYLGADRMTLAWVVKQDIPIKIGTTAQGEVLADGFSLYNLAPMRAGVQGGYVVLGDDGSNICDFYFGKIFDSEETQMLRGKEIDVTAILINKSNSFIVSLMKWTGKPDEFNKAIYANRDNGSLVFNTGWTEADSMFISEEALQDEHTVTDKFTVPSDANNYAIVIIPAQAEQPMSLKLKELKVDVSDPFTGFIIKDTEMRGESHLAFDEEYKELVQDNQGFDGLRYTINNDADGQPIPCGMIKKGSAKVSIDSTVNQIAGSSAKGGDGAIKFDTDGEATINTELLIWNEQATASTVTFWWALVSPDGGTYSKVPESETTFTVAKGSIPTKFTMKQFSTVVAQGDRIALRASSSVADGVFIESTGAKNPMVVTKVRFKELISSSDAPDLVVPEDFDTNDFDVDADGKIKIRNAQYIQDRLDQIDSDVVITDAAKKAGFYIELDVTMDGRPSLSAKQRKI